MQYQIYNKHTNELVAWIDTKENNVVISASYGIRSGNNLKVVEITQPLNYVTYTDYDRTRPE